MKPLPLATAPAPEATAPLAGMIQVYDPAMCCSTGLCGPGVDPALLQIARDLRALEAQGATVHRLGLSQEPGAFAANPRVTGLMQAFGDGALPATLVNGEVLVHGRYPTRDELIGALARWPSSIDRAGSGCTPGSGCC